jgi:drug/metabolite transporter (DMT)-like permease
LGVNIIYAASYTIAKEIAPSLIAASGFVFFRVFGAILFLFPILLAMKIFKLPQKKDIFLFLCCGLFGVATNMLLFFEGLTRTSPVNASLIMVMSPLIVLILSLVLKKEKFRWYNYIGFILGTGGALLFIISKSGNIKTEGSMMGDLMILANACSFAIFLVIVKPLMKEYHPLLVTFYCFCAGLIYIIPFGLIPATQTIFSDFTSYSWFCLFFIIIATTVLTYIWNAFAIKHTTSSTVSAYIYLQPILGTVIALLSKKYMITQNQIIFSIIIILGVFLSGLKLKKNKNISSELN